MANRSHILEVRGEQGAEVFRALANESRLAILQLLAAGDRNINELGQALGLSQPTVTKHIQQLEQAGLVVSEYRPGVQGMQKRCRLRHDRLLVTFEAPHASDQRVEETSMPIGLYTLAHPVGTCGLANRTKIIGFLDKPQSFFDPERATAQILWMEDGFVEYTFPNDLPTSMEVTRLELLMEVCSEAPDYNLDWPSDITVWINGVEVGTWTSPGDFGGKRGVLNPDWWIDHMTQHGLLKVWSVDPNGSSVDGNVVSDVRLDRLLVLPQSPITVRIGVKPDAEHRGGFNLFGSGFGNYAQDLLLRLTYDSKNPAARRSGFAHSGGREERS
jgi:predicted transcriptional regulator